MARSTGPTAQQKQEQRLAELVPPKNGIEPPPYSLAQDLCKQRERIFGVTGASLLTQTGQERLPTAGGSSNDIARRSKTVRNREIRLRRMMLIEPRVPRAYNKTTQVIRAGQSLFADFGLRVPAVLAAKPFQVKAQPLDDEDDSMKATTRKEEFTHAVFLGQAGQRSKLDTGKVSVWRDLFDNLVSAGEGAFGLHVRRDRWSEDDAHYPRRADFVDDGEDVASSSRKTGAGKYLVASERYRRGVCPFTLEHIDPQMVYTVENSDGVEDECVVVAQRPYRATLVQHGLKPTERKYGTDNVDVFSSTSSGARYELGPQGLGKPYPIRDFPTGRYQPESVETVTYYCSGQRATYLGLSDGSDPDLGVWAHYVDGVLVDYGPLWGPPEHPLPIFSTPGLSTAIPDPNYTGIPALMHLIELSDLLDQIFTMEMHIAFWSAFPPVLEEDKTSGGGGATGLPGTIDIDPEAAQRPGSNASTPGGGIKYLEPGKFYTVPTGKTWRYFTMPQEATIHLEKLYTKARELFDLLGVPGVFRGAGGPSQAGYAISQLMIAAKSLFDPLIDNASTTVGRAVKYLWWQVWKRFPEGVPVYVGGDGDRTHGWITLTPTDIAPDCPKGQAGKGIPFLQCTVRADPLLPQDEFQLEQRGINAVAAGMLDEDTAREKYFQDPSPEKTAARIIADKIAHHPVTVANEVYRGLVRSGSLLPVLAVFMYAKGLGVDPAMSLQQLSATGALNPQQSDQAQQVLDQHAAQQAIAAGVTPPGTTPVPGMANGPGGPPQAQLPQMAPTPPATPPLQPAMRAGLAAPTNQHLTNVLRARSLPSRKERHHYDPCRYRRRDRTSRLGPACQSAVGLVACDAADGCLRRRS